MKIITIEQFFDEYEADLWLQNELKQVNLDTHSIWLEKEQLRSGAIRAAVTIEDKQMEFDFE